MPREYGPAGRQTGIAQVRRELGDEHRRRRREVMRIDDLEQRLREARKLRLELELNAGGEERDTLEQPLDIRIVDFEAVHPEARRYLWELFGELRS